MRPARRQPCRVHGDRQHAGRSEPEGLELLPVELRVSERKIDVADERAQLLAAERGETEQLRIVRREERRGRDVVVLQDPRTAQPTRTRAVIGDGSAKWKMVTSPPRAPRIGERPDVAPQRVVDRQREDIGLVSRRHEASGEPDGRCRRSRRRGGPPGPTG